MIRIGVMGGNRGKAFVQLLKEDPRCRITVICEPMERRRVELQKEFPEIPVVESYEEMLREGMDVVILANVFHQHAKYAIRAMDAGIDVVSETTAAPTAGECLDLVECAERTGRKYMLAVNCTSYPSAEELKRLYREGKMGEVMYAEAEYPHQMTPTDLKGYGAPDELSPGKLHWRRYLPGTYYNMHSLGVLMDITGLRPVRVTGMEIASASYAERTKETKKNHSPGAICLYEMENGAVFRSTGCCSFGPTMKWYRLSCEWGTMESARADAMKVLVRSYDGSVEEYAPHPFTEEEKAGTHGGIDGRMVERMMAYLTDRGEPVMDVYAAVNLSLAGIYGFYSIIEGKTLSIPDIRDREARECLRGDYRSPFPTEDGTVTLRCSTIE